MHSTSTREMATRQKCNSPAGLERAKSATEDKIINKRLAGIRPSPENDRIYAPIQLDDPEIRALAKSIREHGLQEPIVITMDRYILSGHRRYAACKLLGRTTVRCRMVGYKRRDDIRRFVNELREFNRQRCKTVAEVAREEVVSTNPDEPFRMLSRKREKDSRVGVAKFDTRQRQNNRGRNRLTAAKTPMVEAVQALLQKYRQYLPVSARKIHYWLLNDPPLVNANRDKRYANTRRNYSSLCDLLIRMRIEGIIPWEHISDDTRPLTKWDAYRNPQPFIRRQLDQFFKGYYRDLLQSQPNHIELMVEKNTVAASLKRLSAEYCLPMFSARGYCSGRPRWELARRFRASGKEKLILLIVSDHDPDGVEIAHSFARSMAKDFGLVREVHPIKVAVTAEQVQELKLTSGGKAKPGASTYEHFIERYGDDVYEVEALEPQDLLRIVRQAIDSVIDIEAFNREVELEKSDLIQIANVRAAVLDAINEQGMGG